MPRVTSSLSRRALLMAATAVSLARSGATSSGPATPSDPGAAPVRHLKQAICRWPFQSIALPELCRRAKAIGLAGIDLLYPDEWAVATDAGLAVSMAYPARREGFNEVGFNDPRNHRLLLNELEAAIPPAARAGAGNVIVMTGNRRPGISDAAAIENCATGLSRIAPLAAEHDVTLCLELLNSRVDHPGYSGDHLAFGLAVLEHVRSPRLKLLFDIYHMQIMEGDIIHNIRAHIDSIGHFHTGGVPGRHEINGGQELNYRAIAAAIAAAGYEGFVAHEFMPTRADVFESIAEAFEICNV